AEDDRTFGPRVRRSYLTRSHAPQPSPAMDLHVGRALTPLEIESLLSEARARTALLVHGLSDDDLRRQHDPLMSPIVWDLGHIAHYEEVWLLEKLGEAHLRGEGLRGIYNPFDHPRAARAALSLPGGAEARAY